LPGIRTDKRERGASEEMVLMTGESCVKRGDAFAELFRKRRSLC
jgi:hypothetical protein